MVVPTGWPTSSAMTVTVRPRLVIWAPRLSHGNASTGRTISLWGFDEWTKSSDLSRPGQPDHLGAEIFLHSFLRVCSWPRSQDLRGRPAKTNRAHIAVHDRDVCSFSSYDMIRKDPHSIAWRLTVRTDSDVLMLDKHGSEQQRPSGGAAERQFRFVETSPESP